MQGACRNNYGGRRRLPPDVGRTNYRPTAFDIVFTQMVTGQLSDKPTRRQPSRRQTNSLKLIYGRFGPWMCLFGSWTLRTHAAKALKPRSDWQVSGTRKNAILSTRSRSAHKVATSQPKILFIEL